MPRKPTRKRPDSAAVLRSLVRIIHRQTDAMHLLRLGVQSTRISMGRLHEGLQKLHEAIEKRVEHTGPGKPLVPTIFEPPLSSPLETELERQLDDAMNSTGAAPRW